METNSKEKKINLMLIDDHPLVRQGLKKVFDKEKNFFLLAEAPDADIAIKKLAALSPVPDIIIIDISLKDDYDGIDLISIIRKRFGDIKILILSMHDEAVYVERAIRSGANGYVTKNDPLDNVIDSIKAIIGGDLYISTSITGKFVKKLINIPEKQVSDNKCYNSLTPLTERELEVFKLIGTGHVTGEIARELNVSVNTIESHRRHIKEKLDIKKGSDLLKYAIQWITNNKIDNYSRK